MLEGHDLSYEEKVPQANAHVGCRCGWPVDSCNPQFAAGNPCGRERHDTLGEGYFILRCSCGFEQKLAHRIETLNDALLSHRLDAIEQAISANRPDPRSAFIGG